MEPLLVILLIGASTFLVLALSSASAVRFSNDSTFRNSGRTVRQIRLLAGGQFAIAFVWLVFIVIVLWSVPHDIRFENALGIGLVCGAIAAIALVSGLALKQLAGLFVGFLETNPVLERAIEQRTERASKWAWAHGLLCGITLLPLGGMLVLIPALLIAATFPFILFGPRGRKWGQLLWLLSIAVTNRRNVADELRAHALNCGRRYGNKLLACADLLDAGNSLGEALAGVRGLLPRWITSSIQIAEESGTLQTTMAELARQQLDQLRANYSTVSLSRFALYAVEYLVCGLAIVVFLMIFIVPKFKRIYQDFGLDLPQATKTLISIAEWTAAYWFLLVPVAALAIWGLVELLLGDASRWRSLRYRILRRIYPSLDAPDLLRFLARLMDSGQTLNSGLAVLAKHHFRPTVRQSLQHVCSQVEAGEDLWRTLRSQQFLTDRDLQLIETAQRSRNLSWALRELAELRERHMAYRAQAILELARPVVVLFAGAVVMSIVIPFILPLFSLTSSLA